jgi:hypothetical protein
MGAKGDLTARALGPSTLLEDQAIRAVQDLLEAQGQGRYTLLEDLVAQGLVAQGSVAQVQAQALVTQAPVAQEVVALDLVALDLEVQQLAVQALTVQDLMVLDLMVQAQPVQDQVVQGLVVQDLGARDLEAQDLVVQDLGVQGLAVQSPVDQDLAMLGTHQVQVQVQGPRQVDRMKMEAMWSLSWSRLPDTFAQLRLLHASHTSLCISALPTHLRSPPLQ